MLGRPATRISGDITRKGGGYLLRLRVGERVIEAVGGPHPPAPDIDRLIHDGAQDLLQAVDPFALASYFFNGPEAGTAAPNTMWLVQAVLRTEHVDDRAWALSLWASVLLGQGREDEAMEKYRAALATDERIGSQHALENLAKALVRHGREAEAPHSSMTSPRGVRPALENLVAAAVAYGRLGHWDRALATAELAARHHRHSVLAHQIHGFALGGLHRYDQAIEALRHSRDLDRANSTTEFLLTWMLTQAGRNDEAMRIANEAVARIPGGHHQQAALGFAQLALGEAARRLRKLRARRRELADVRGLQARAGATRCWRPTIPTLRSRRTNRRSRSIRTSVRPGAAAAGRWPRSGGPTKRCRDSTGRSARTPTTPSPMSHGPTCSKRWGGATRRRRSAERPMRLRRTTRHMAITRADGHILPSGL